MTADFKLLNFKMIPKLRVCKSEWLTLTFILVVVLAQFVLQVSNQEISPGTPAPRSGVSPPSSLSSSMSCICDGNCERVVESECPWGLTLDVCGCCLACARGENEPCGGALGNCAAGLNCQLSETTDTADTETVGVGVDGESSESEKTGTCTKTSQQQFGADDCLNAVTVQKFGCGLEEGYLDEDEEEEDDSDSDGEYEDTYNNNDCEGVECDEELQCPPDSHRSPRLVRAAASFIPERPRRSRARVQRPRPSPYRHSYRSCCPSLPELCQCNPPSACPKPSCTREKSMKLVRLGTSMPGTCCPEYICEDEDGAVK